MAGLRSYGRRPIAVLWSIVAFLSLRVLVRAAPTDVPSAASFYITNLPDLHQDEGHPLQMWSGHLSSDPSQASASPTDVTPHLFFVLTKARRSADKERVIFWFNGGPGCSSFDGLMMEVGPWRVDGKGGLKTQEGGWEEYANVVYVDQPAGTGFSYTSTDKYVHELTEARDQFIIFLRNFYHVFPEYKGMDTYLAGESYAGQYIPYFADGLLNSDLGVPLMGAAIGNGWIDGRHQYPSFLEYAVKHGLVDENSNDYKRGKQAIDKCIDEIDRQFNSESPEPVSIEDCEGLMAKTLAHKERVVDGQKMCVNIYDVRLEDTSPACGMNWPPDLADVTTYLGRNDVKRALHATAHQSSWTECHGRVHSQLRNRKSHSSIKILPSVIERIPVMLFAGDQDFICNYMGQEALINAMTWNGGTGLGTVQTQTWTVNEKPAGTWVSARNLTYVKVFDASHMVGYDVPHVAHDMILRFMGIDFSKITDGSAKIPSAVGEDKKVMWVEQKSDIPTSGKPPVIDKAALEEYFSAGSAALVLVLILAVIAGIVWCRIRRRRALKLPVSLPLNRGDVEESIPLRGQGNGHSGDDADEFRQRSAKGKERALEEQEAIFEVGDSDDEDAKSPAR
ncbi:alpha/beta-hydrolase [Punctularia strigosozonata HHB-11173 SS5]|uniref:alpha/beta-hydrolase n=1 Tax=Punctularia strigosozonata (strain HHB-11173) TaxID=741275 RepID=UPI0004416DCF|nr:alpha/beta-hydrolase [Punctularia strigosozonata HHB-11173 SS5]EIN10934.1 alpha/beta-hydrolase [Punctularia strigosozonata HHB-11173 SS5]